MVSKRFQEVIKEYLDSFASKSESFNVKYQNDKKSIEECCNFICSEVQKMGVNGLADDEVYYLARHYYEEDNLEIQDTSCSVVVNQQVELTDEEIKKAKEQAIKDIEEQEKEKLLKKKQDQAKKQQALYDKEKKEQEAKGQLSIFDL